MQFRRAVMAFLVASLWTSSSVGAQSPGPGTAAGSTFQVPAKSTPSVSPATRTVRFTTQEGTWMSVDVSPDGRTLVFDLLGDLYTLPLAGGRATRLTSGRGFDAMPRWSPDGQWIAFVSDREGGTDLWRVRPDGSELRVILNEEINGWQSARGYETPVWRADGLALFAPMRGRLWEIPLDGRPATRVSHTAAMRISQVTGPAATRDGRYLYFSSDDGRGGRRLVRRDLAAHQDEVMPVALPDAMRPVVSPDGTRLAYATRFDGQTGIRLRDLTTGEERWLVYPVSRDMSEAHMGASLGLLPGYAFTPDGRELVIAVDRQIRRVNVATGEVRTVPMTAEVVLEIGPQLRFPHRVDTGAVVRARFIEYPALSPDGERLAFTAFDRIYTQQVSGGTAQLLLPEEVRGAEPAWSPDGRWIAYTTLDFATGSSLWKVPARGGPPVRLATDDRVLRQPTWSADGTRLFAVRAGRMDPWRRVERYMAPELVTVPADGGDATVVPTPSGFNRLSGVGDRIYFMDHAGPSSMTLHGDSVQVHLKLSATNSQVSPDGRHWLVASWQRLYLLRVPDSVDTATARLDFDAPRVPAVLLSSTGVDHLGWADGGSTIVWSVGSMLFRLPLAAVEFGPLGSAAPARPLHPQVTEVVVERPRARPAGSLVLHGARLITMEGAVIERGDLVVTGDRIAALGPAGSVTIPRGAAVIDVSGSTIVPGFIDLHPHWTGLRQRAIDREPWSLRAALAYGVTAGRLPGGGSGDPGVYTFADRQTVGDLLGPRIYAAEPNFGPGLLDPDASAAEVDSLLSKFRRYYRTDFLKQYVSGSRRIRQLVAAAAHKYRLTTTSEGGFNFGLQLTNIMDGFAIEHTYPATPLGEDVLQLIAHAGAVYDPTLVINQGSQGTVTAQDYFYWTTPVHSDPKVRRFIPHVVLDRLTFGRKWYDAVFDPTVRYAEDVARVAQAGGAVVVGSHSEFEGLAFHWEMWSFARGGMPPMEILRAATINGARALGYAQDLGSLAPGKLADLVVLAANPLEDIRHTTQIRWVMRGGVLYDGATLDERWPTPTQRSEPWWWALEPRSEFRHGVRDSAIRGQESKRGLDH